MFNKILRRTCQSLSILLALVLISCTDKPSKEENPRTSKSESARYHRTSSQYLTQIKNWRRMYGWVGTVDSAFIDRSAGILYLEMGAGQYALDEYRVYSTNQLATPTEAIYNISARVAVLRTSELFDAYPEINTLKISSIAYRPIEDASANIIRRDKLVYCTFTISRAQSNRLNWGNVQSKYADIYGPCCNLSTVLSYFDSVWHDSDLIDPPQ